MFGKNICITGTLSRMDRATAYSRIINEGGCPKDKMSKLVDILVITDEMKFYKSKKKTMAQQFGTEIISEWDFYRMVGA